MEVVTDRPMDVEVEVIKEAPENLKVTVAEEISRYWTAVPRKFPSETQMVRPVVVKPEVTFATEAASSSSSGSGSRSSSNSIAAGGNKSVGSAASSGSGGTIDATCFLGSLQSNSESSELCGKSMSMEACKANSCEVDKKPLSSVYNESTSDTDASLFGLPEERTSGSGSNSSSSSSDTSYQNDSSVDRALTRRKSFFLF